MTWCTSINIHTDLTVVTVVYKGTQSRATLDECEINCTINLPRNIEQRIFSVKSPWKIYIFPEYTNNDNASRPVTPLLLSTDTLKKYITRHVVSDNTMLDSRSEFGCRNSNNNHAYIIIYNAQYHKWLWRIGLIVLHCFTSN